jgi:hypothetical protein
MTLQELINPWGALARAKLEIRALQREQALLVQELRKAQKNDQRGKDGKFKKGEVVK